MITKVLKILFKAAFLFILLSIFVLTIGQIIPLEFTHHKIKKTCYTTILIGFPLALFVVLMKNFKWQYSFWQSCIYFISIVLSSIFAFFILMHLVICISFGGWVTKSIMYRHKTSSKEIRIQIYDVGALGYGGERVIEVRPILKYWNFIRKVDTFQINKNEWTFVDEEGDIKYP